MATLAQSALTLSDLRSRLNASGAIDTVIELLLADNDGLLQDIPWMEGNLPTGHKTTVRTGEPTVDIRLINQGVGRGKSTTAQIIDTCAMFEKYSTVDKALADLAGDPMRFRLSEDAAFISAFNKRVSQAVFYGNEGATPGEFTGFAPRFGNLAYENKDNIIDAGGTGSDNASIYMVSWGDQSAHGIYPKGSKAGMDLRDLGEDTLTDGNGNEYQGYRTHFKWDCGLTVRDWRQVVRICNINVSNLGPDPTVSGYTGANIPDLMEIACERINAPGANTAFYMPRRIREMARRQAKNLKNVRIGMSEIAGRKFLSFDEYPVRRVDALLLTEARVV